jgi:4-hydroxythreonine-4-phosphate dehydrogenase
LQKNLKIGISIGDINGIGLEIILKTFKDKRMLDICTPILFGSSKLINEYKKLMSLENLSFFSIKDMKEVKSRKINVFESWNENITLALGENNPDGGKYAFLSLEKASNELINNSIDALVTAPINKKNIQSEKFAFPGHTEYLANKKKENVLMLMTSEKLKVGVVTSHIPLENVAQNISEDSILQKLELLHNSLKQDFGIRQPKIAVLGLNPHAGDNGVLGKEESSVIEPTIEKAKNNNILVFGPYAADSFFGSPQMNKFDAVLAMYHDQGLIPFKTISFGQGVNYSAGLSFVRTSPDHGTAYDIAGKNMADESSFREAIYLACDIAKKRKEYKHLNANVLKTNNRSKSKYDN